jgi:hypothetical protein
MDRDGRDGVAVGRDEVVDVVLAQEHLERCRRPRVVRLVGDAVRRGQELARRHNRAAAERAPTPEVDPEEALRRELARARLTPVDDAGRAGRRARREDAEEQHGQQEPARHAGLNA